jgi:hypothetical protein
MPKICYILRGVSGSGKTECALALSGGNGAVICSADDHFIDPITGEYHSNWRRAHEACLSKFKDLVEVSAPMIIVCNTNTREREFRAYQQIAEQAGYKVFCLIVENRHGGANVHDVPKETLEKQIKRFAIKLA